jgi:Protein of unknown function (DUF1559)
MSRFIALAFAATVLALPATAAEPKFDAEACAKAVAPFLDDQTFAVLHVDLTSLDVDALITKAAAVAKMEAGAIAPLRKDLTSTVKTLTDIGAHDFYVVVSLADVPEHSPFVVIPLPAVHANELDAKTTELRGKLKGAPLLGSLHFDLTTAVSTRGWETALIGGDKTTLKRRNGLQPDARPELGKAFAVADGSLAQLAIFPPKDAAKILESVMPTLPAEVGGGSSKVLAQGFHWAALGVKAPDLDGNLTVQASDADAAKALLDLHDKVFAAIGKSKEAREMLAHFDQLKPLLRPKVDGDRLTLKLEVRTLMTALHADEAVAKVVEVAERTKSINNMKQLTLAAHNYLDKYGVFPPAYTTDKDGKRLLSWRVHLLPYLEQDKLYKEFHLDEPWDSDHNKKLIARMPAVFRSSADPKLAAAGKTTYLAPIGEATMWPGSKGVRIADVTDGTSNTIFLVDAVDEAAVEWTKPEDLGYDANAPMTGLGARYHGGFLAALADGSVRLINIGISKTTLQAAFTRNGGEILGADW